MTPLTARSNRFIWGWCLAYTAVAPRDVRERRRDEIRDHLWESERAGYQSRSVLGAAAAGLADDVIWAGGLGFRRLMTSFLTPVPYLVIAGILPIQGAVYWGSLSGRAGHLGTLVSAIAAFACLTLAGLTYLLRRRR